MNIAIVEDEEDSVRLLCSHIKKYCEEKKIAYDVSCFSDGLEFLARYSPAYDVVFMDIEMPNINGMETAKRLRASDAYVPLVFITNLKQYALQGYKVEALDYLVKPVGYAAFSTMFSRVRKKIPEEKVGEIVVHTRAQTIRIRISDILYVETLQHFLYYHTVNGVVKIWGTLAEVEEKLPEDRFLRCNNSYIVNLEKVDRIEGDEVCIGEERLKISRGKKKEFIHSSVRYLSGGKA